VKNFSIRTSCARAAAVLLVVAGASAALTACAPLIIGGALVSSGLVVTDRRTTGIQLEDQTIELKAGTRLRDLATLGRIEVTSYNRVVLLTGEVPAEADRATVEKAVAALENVRSVVNELAVMSNSTLGSRSNDTLLSAKVKATLVDAKDVHANAYKVVTERAVIYLMGRVTEREAGRGAELARAVPGVKKVVRVFEILSEAELAALGPTAVK
jgi:osmotically-inducible protein OsmY